MFLKNSLVILFRTHVWKQHPKASSISSNIQGGIPAQILIEGSEETLNPDMCNLLCSLCAPGTESFDLEKNVKEMIPSHKAQNKYELNTNNFEASSHKNPDDSRLFIHKTGALHMTYSEPARSTK